MTEDTTYNGWKNYPTWAVNLWIDNDQGTQDWALEQAADALTTAHPRYEMSQALKNMVREDEPEDAAMFTDLLGWALDCVDWYEIADAYLDMVRDDPSVLS